MATKKALKPVTAIVLGAGGRGNGYGNYALQVPSLLKIVGVAEPRQFQRDKMIADHGIAADMVWPDWETCAAESKKRGRLADAVLVCVQDALHEDAAIAFARLGYHILLEKPMAPTLAACKHIHSEIKKAGVMCAVCHVMRYTKFTQWVKKIVDSGELGEIVNIEHMEPVGFWHQAHSFVRGNWRNEKESSFMLLAKSCHDIDWLCYIIGKPCLRAASFGSLKHFRKECKPEGAADRCLDCKLSPKCCYSAKRFYFDRLANKKDWGWPLDVVDPYFTKKTLTQALREGPYGRCVYECDNDVVDNQVVALEFADGVTAAFTMCAFNALGGRKTRIGGTKGFLETQDSSTIKVHDFLTGKVKEIDTNAADASLRGGHGGGDGGIINEFCYAIQHNKPSAIITDVDASLESHKVVFAAEKSRRSGKIEQVK